MNVLLCFARQRPRYILILKHSIKNSTYENFCKTIFLLWCRARGAFVKEDGPVTTIGKIIHLLQQQADVLKSLPLLVRLTISSSSISFVWVQLNVYKSFANWKRNLMTRHHLNNINCFCEVWNDSSTFIIFCTIFLHNFLYKVFAQF